MIKKKILNRIGLGKPQGKQEQTMHKTVFIEIFDLRPVLKFFKPLLASPGGVGGGGRQTRCVKDDVQINNFMSQRAYEARRKFVEHERSVTLARGAVESNQGALATATATRTTKKQWVC